MDEGGHGDDLTQIEASLLRYIRTMTLTIDKVARGSSVLPSEDEPMITEELAGIEKSRFEESRVHGEAPLTQEDA